MDSRARGVHPARPGWEEMEESLVQEKGASWGQVQVEREVLEVSPEKEAPVYLDPPTPCTARTAFSQMRTRRTPDATRRFDNLRTRPDGAHLKEEDMKHIIITLCALGALTACGPDVPPAGTPDMSDQTPQSDMSDMPDETPDETSDVPDACVGETECPDNVCGTFVNACGEELTCEPCLCEGATPTVETCGPCNLGRPTCTPDGSFSCTLPEVPGLTEEICDTGVLYVSSAPVEGERDGSRDRPFDSPAAAGKEAEVRGARLVVISGDETYTELLEVRSGVSVLGGFDAAFRHDPQLRPTFAPDTTSGDQIGLFATNVTAPTLVSGVLVQAPAATDSGASSMGMLAVDAPALILEDVVIRAGTGAPGTNGTNGEPGASGEPGGDAAVAFCDGIQPFLGAGGENAACPMSRGGGGGRGLAGQQDATAGATSPAGTQGGLAGTPNSPNGRDGLPGSLNALPGASGPGGKSGGAWMGDRFVSQGAGVSGLRGLDGPGGGGGGGSHSNSWETFTCRGSAGGGGGAGGCGGGAGTGGGAGGASIGALLVRSPLTMTRARIIAELGGRGGAGGQGALGGQGASGGQGNSLKSNGGIVRGADHAGGDGGRGADGLAGGHGGGGAGGPSVSLWCERSAPTLSDDVELDQPGIASGGTSPGNPGEDGLSARSFLCP